MNKAAYDLSDLSGCDKTQIEVAFPSWMVSSVTT